MTFEVRLSDQAKQDLGDIYDYIAHDLQNSLVAEGFAWKIGKSHSES